MSYIIYLSLESFLKRAEESKPSYEPLYADVLVEFDPRSEYYRSYILAGFRDPYNLHSCYISIEHAVPNPGTERILAERAALAWRAFEEAIDFCSVHRGLLLCPGLQDSLGQYEASHTLWTWEHYDRLPQRRLVIATSGEAPALARGAPASHG